jgi:hypothetical protein
MTTKTTLSLTALFAALFAVAALYAAPPPSGAGLAQGPYSSMHMLLEKTFLKVDVLTVKVRFGKGPHKKLLQLAQGKQYSDALGREIANVAIGSTDALIELDFQRDVSLDQWIDAVRENLDQAKAAGLISAATKDKVSRGLPKWFAAIQDRGYEEHDRLLYRVKAGSLRTVVVSAAGRTLLDFTDNDPNAPKVVMASYFAPGSDFRKPLLKSLFK